MVERWRAYGLNERGRHKTMSSALDAAFKDLITEKNDFFDLVADNWKRLFPDLPISPGRYEDGRIFLYVKNASASFAQRSKLPMIKRRLSELPGAPKRLNLRLEIHAS